MLKSVFRFAARLAVLAALLYLARSALKRWIEGPEPSPTAERWAPATEAPRAAPPANVAAEPAVKAGPVPEVKPEPVDDRPAAARRPVSRATGTASGDWVAPDETGAAPSTHPVKAKLGSKVYREPGSSGYDRCRPDRCYTSAAAAEADGFARAKR